ncbi:MAG TPA: cupin domain-containing protein [Candidatus Gallacutalibacter pullicola]|uniref:Cupin domain-containing protein n=1 Tax=Candidatus Gallacutalibacter pullicola TaxID=2840830 RepID=A0A9D1DRP7_9FIRM|nr:cupin domain-containing protein [Candidatus Gallacutalibacter pullicola]
METRIIEIAERIRGLRELLDFTPAEMAEAAGISEKEYMACENAETDFSFTFLYKCAAKLGVDMVELLTGENPHLSFYSIIRSGKGLDIKRRPGLKYEHLGYLFKPRLAEPFLVHAPYLEEEQDQPIPLSYHEGQEFDYILSGSLKVQLEGHTEILNEGDAIYYDSSRGHGMIAVGGKPCQFIAMILKKPKEGAD